MVVLEGLSIMFIRLKTCNAPLLWRLAQLCWWIFSGITFLSSLLHYTALVVNLVHLASTVFYAHLVWLHLLAKSFWLHNLVFVCTYFGVCVCQWHGLLWFMLHVALESSYRISLLFLWLRFLVSILFWFQIESRVVIWFLEDVWQVGSNRKWQCWGASSKCSRSWLGNFRGMYSCRFHCMLVSFMRMVHLACRHFLNYLKCFVISSQIGSWSFARTMISSSLWELMNVSWMALSDLPKVTLSHYFLPQIIAVWRPWLLFSSHYGVE